MLLRLVLLAGSVAPACGSSPSRPPARDGNCNCTNTTTTTTPTLHQARAEAIEVKCGNYDTADKTNAQALVDHWRRDTSEFQDGRCPVPAKTCRRFACWNTSGTYVCNDNDHEIVLDCADGFDRFAGRIAKGCCKRTHLYSKGGSGHVVTDQGYKVIIAYANCRHHRDSVVPSAGGENPNGPCKPGTRGGSPCDPGSEKYCGRL